MYRVTVEHLTEEDHTVFGLHVKKVQYTETIYKQVVNDINIKDIADAVNNPNVKFPQIRA